MSLNLITGYSGKAHIKASSDGAVNAGMYGSGKYVLNMGQKFAYELISNNLIRIKSGYAINQGRKIELELNDYEDVQIDTGLQGMKRTDLIAITYTKDASTGIENATMQCIKGTSGDSYADPEYTSGNILEGEAVDDFLLYRVNINGISIESVEPLFKVTDSLTEIIQAQADAIAVNAENIEKKADVTLINQAAKTWVLPDDLSEYIYDAGEPDVLKYPPSQYAGLDNRYVDVLTGNMYYVHTEMDRYENITHTWTYEKTLESVQSAIDALNSNLDKLVFKKVFITLASGVGTYTLNGVTSSSIISAHINQDNKLYVVHVACSDNTITVKASDSTATGVVSCILIGRL